ncbi:hypothetical protein PybrP1_000821 [[Pythium] brassicae (nom. inval.)]|nr:hypothetical protein PybrP1_000821 [[Pythium] brassicae (nom. inval.)]
MSSSEASNSERSGGAFSDRSSSSNAQAGGDRSQRSSLADSSDGAVFISSRSEIVISPRRRVGASTWDTIEPLLSGGSSILRRVKRAASSRGPSRTLSNTPTTGRAVADTPSTARERNPASATGTNRAAAVGASAGAGSEASCTEVRHGRRRDDAQKEKHSDSDSDSDNDNDEEEKPPRSRAVRSQKKAATDSRTTSSRRESRTGKTSKASRTDKHVASKGREVARRSSRTSSPSSSSRSFSRSPTPTTNRKPVSFMSESSDCGGGAAVLPSPKEEMEELKQTLKKLASYGEDNSSVHAPDGVASRSLSPGIANSSDSVSQQPSHSLEYLRVATAALQPPPSAEQLRFGESVSQQPCANSISSKPMSSSAEQKAATKSSGGSGRASRHASFDPAALDAKLRRQDNPNSSSTGASGRPKSMTAAGRGGDAVNSSATEIRSSLHQKLFGEARDSRGRVGAFMPSSNPGTSGTYGIGSILGIGGATAAATGAGGGSAQGSRAVLSALKALQDKIQRLEEERESLLQQLSDEKVKARKREAELASSEKKFSYELGQTKESARAAYDAIRSEREELKVELVKAEERRRGSEKELQHFHALMQTYAAKSEDLQTQLEISEAQRTRLQTEISHLSATSRSEAQELLAKVNAFEQQQAAVQEQLKRLDEQFEREASNHAETRERLHDSEQTVASISQLNEKLVARVWEVTESANKAAKLNKKLVQQQRVSAVSRTTAASRAAAAGAGGDSGAAGAVGAASRRPGAGIASSAGADATSRGSKRAVASGASVAGKKSLRKTKRRDPLAAAAAAGDGGLGLGLGSGRANNMELLRDANLGREIPFLLGTSANQSFSLIGNVQDAIRQCDTTYVTPNTLTGEPIRVPTALALGRTATGAGRTRQPAASSHGQRAPSASARRKAGKSSAAAPVSANILGVPSPSPATLLSERTRNGAATASSKADKRVKPRALQMPPPAPVSAHINPMQTQIMEDLAAALRCAEEEFAALNDRYREVVARMQAERSDAGGDGGSSSAQLSSALGPLLDELEAKGKQVNLLQQVLQQAANSSINPLRRVVHSPEAIRRKTASLRLLNEYRQLERNARASSPSHQHQYPPHRSTAFFSDHEQR